METDQGDHVDDNDQAELVNGEVSIEAEPDEETQERNGVTDLPYKDFKPVDTVVVSALSMISSVAMIAAIFLVPIFCESDPPHDKPPKCSTHPFSILIYTHAAYWAFHLFIDPYLKAKHKKNRIQGYLLFYDDTKNVRRAPFYILSVGNFCLLLADTVLNDFCDRYPDSCTTGRFERVDWLRGFVTIEAMGIMFLHIYYIRKILTFNKEKFKPDVMRPEIMYGLGASMFLKFPRLPGESEMHRAGRNREEIRYLRMMHAMMYLFGDSWKEEDDNVRVMQAEMISFLITQIRRKNRKIVNLYSLLAEFTPDVEGDLERLQQIVLETDGRSERDPR